MVRGTRSPFSSTRRMMSCLGRATETEGLKRVAVIGGGVGTAIAYPVAKKLHDDGCHVDLIVGFRNKDLIILKEEGDLFKIAGPDHGVLVGHGVLVRTHIRHLTLPPA